MMKGLKFISYFVFSCGVKWNGSDDGFKHISYIAYIYIVGFFIPVSIIFTSYYKIIKTIKYKVNVHNTKIST